MNPSDVLTQIDDISQELDMVVYQLELPPEGDETKWREERQSLRRKLERLRDRLENLANNIA